VNSENLPTLLQAACVERLVLANGALANVPKATPEFPEWRGLSPADTYNGKPLLDYLNTPVFAELFVLRLLEVAGWKGMWVNSYRREYLTSYHPQVRAEVPNSKHDLLSRIAGEKSFPSGCWDVFAWRGDAVIFAECKRAKKDAIRPSQLRWLQNALAVGIHVESFLIVEWTFPS
jgi:hypothetical protein